MKKIAQLLVCMLMPIVIFAQSFDKKIDSLKIQLDSMGISPESQSGRALQWLAKDLHNMTSNPAMESYNSEIPRYCIYPTSNMWTFIKLDTRNGRLWQVQYSVKGDDYRFETPLSIYPLVNLEEGIDGRFTLIQTQNTYNFIMLDQYNGNTYQAQWSMDEDNRCVMPITIK